MPEQPLTETGPSLADGEVLAQKKPFIPGAGTKRYERQALAAAVAFQLVMLLAMIFGHTVPYFGAKTVLLKVVPVDPRDFFRGDYVTLGYDISRIPYNQFQVGEAVFATLIPEADGRHYRAGQFLKSPPPAGTVFIQGTSQGSGRASYGIETFYVQETTGHDYERAVQAHALAAQVALTPEGHSSLQRLVIE